MSKFDRTTSIIRTVVVDDSAFARKVVREILSRSPFIEVVGAAQDGADALDVVAELKPDVVTCDLVMPRMDGVEFVRRQMALCPLPILILSASSQEGSQVIEALEAGAVDFLQKPTSLATDRLWNLREDLAEKVKAAARVELEKLPSLAIAPPPVCAGASAPNVDIVVIGVSTGGPQALRYLLPRLSADFPVPIAIVLHMPVGYTASLAEKLNALAPLKITEAEEGSPLLPGTVILARAGWHLTLQRNPAGQVQVHLDKQPLDKLHRPAVDVLFQSAADIYDGRVLGVVLTGMGDDGKHGAAWIKAKGGVVLTEAEESCVIYGMPRVVVESGLSDGCFRLENMAEGILQHL